ncbi:FliM/FliN family flagellar motor C-terminal domain-containing protein [Paracoccus sp. MKU1]|uniref:FliM/FliN family flagellar motor C-terminal domain-containing protein n=1 Tax=Paracoccus sp. MKU1 TaxID=1745182 RepID=UPI001EEFDF74|nr:FliM/FliN family flagellar motor C-terminal domain-containing protein [Paracoccus sp. MKU1]
MLRRWIAERDRTRAAAGPPTQQTDEFRLERAAATALARAAEKQLRLPVFVERLERMGMTLAELPELLPERALLAVVGGRRDALGVVALCPDLLAALIEMQAIGRVTSRPAPPRKPTRTDAAISADFVNALLAELGRECAARDGCPDFGAFRYVTYMDDPRPLSLMLEDGEMTHLSFHFRMGGSGQRDGRLLIALPAEIAPRTDAPPSSGRNQPQLPVAQSAPLAPPPAPASLAETVQQAPIRLTGILCRRRLSLHQLRSLTPGSLLPLTQNVLDEARVETAHGQLLARGRLGEKDGFHAIRLRNIGQDAESAATTPTQDAWRPESFGPPFDGAPPPEQTGLPLADLDHPDAFRLAETMPSMVKAG